MAGAVALGGYTVPITTVLLALGLLVGTGLVVSFALTIGLSSYRYLKATRRERVRGPVQSTILDKAFSPDANWEEWVSTLSTTERSMALELLGEYLRELEGSEAESLKDLGAALNVPEQARAELEQGHMYERLQALTWLIRLEDPEPYRTAAYEPQTAPERASVARLLYETEALDTPEAEIRLLLEGVSEEFSIFGQDTLYRLANESPDVMFELAAEQYETWSPPLLAQVLLVAGQLETGVRTADISWLTASLEADDEGVRAAAAGALSGFGWRPELRDSISPSQVTSDPSPRVRGAVYEMLGEWGDHKALTALIFALVSEEDPRALVRGTNALVRRQDRIDEHEAAILGSAWEWSTEHASYDSVSRGRTQRVEG